MKIYLAKKIGFCFGVKRAFNAVVEASKKENCQVLGPLVHNEEVKKKLQEKGVEFIDSLVQAKKGATVVFSAHGELPEVFKRGEEEKIKIIDTTCPLVRKAQNLAKKFQEEGRQVVIIGDKNHKEVKSIQGAINNQGIIIEEEKDIFGFETSKPFVFARDKPIGAVAQTTQNYQKVKMIIKELKKRFKDIKFGDTLCPTVVDYQEEVKNLSKKTELVLIIGSKTSANTKRLFEIAKNSGKKVYHIENAGQLEKNWFEGIKKVGIATGTSTPEWLVKETIKKLNGKN